MKFNNHSRLVGEHAFLSASSYHWVNYDDEKLDYVFLNHLAKQKGTRLHEFASQAIDLGVKLPANRSTLNLYVNDAIKYQMQAEQVLYYSPHAFGTADAISFKKNLLRIHDLKTGRAKASMKQLEVYSALFCLEYDYDPKDIGIELRLYQSGEVIVHNPDPDEVRRIMEQIVRFDRRINDILEE